MPEQLKPSFLFVSLILSGFLITAGPFPAFAQTSKSTIEHPGRAVDDQKGIPVTADFVKRSITEYIKVKSKSTKGTFLIHDEKSNKDWRLKLVKIHDPVRLFEREGMMIYFACVDFKSVDTKDLLDLDFWLVPKGKGLDVIETKIHKVNGEPRYGYDGINLKEVR